MKLPDYSLEREVIKNGFKAVAGVDEAGRGPGAGPVVAAAVRIPREHVEDLLGTEEIRDSKKMSARKREGLYDVITGLCDYGVGIINNDIIDEINVLEATKLAMIAAINSLEYCEYVLIDGNVPLKTHHAQTNVIKGDNISISIAAASIVAKVTRDRIMYDLHEIFPIYDWNKNKGYLTKEHIGAIETYGVTEFHRLSFKRVGK
jgi:ribonuclease HII